MGDGNKFMRKIWMIAGSVVLGLPLVGALLLMMVDVNQFRPKIQGVLEEKLHRQVKLGAMSLKWYPLAIRIEDVSIGESPKFASANPFLSAKQFDVKVDVGALLKKQVEVDALNITRPQLELIRGKDGKWNFSELASGGDSSSSSGGAAIALRSLTIQDAKLSVTDLRPGGVKAAYDHIDIAVNNFAPGKPYTAELKAPLEGNAKAGLGLQVSGVAGGTDVDGKFKFDEVPLAILGQFVGTSKGALPPLVLNGEAAFRSRGDDMKLSSATIQAGGVKITGSGEVKGEDAQFSFQTDAAQLSGLLQMARVQDMTGTGTITLKVKVSGPMKALTYAGTASLRDASLKFPELSKPVQIQSADVRIAPDQLTLALAQAGIGSSHAKGALNVHNFAKPVLDFSLDIDKIDTLELETLFVAPAAGGGKSNAKSAPAPPLRGAGKVTIAKLTANQFVLTDISATCDLEGTTIKLDPLIAKLYGGTHTGSVTLSTSGEKPTYALKSGVTKVDAGLMLNALSSMKNMLTGILEAETDLKIVPAVDVSHGLNGTLKLGLANGKLAGVHMMDELSSIAKFVGYQKQASNYTNILKLGGTFKIVNGVAATDDLALEIEGATLAAAGTLGLTDQSVKMNVTATLAKGASQAVGGSQVGGLLQTVLSNSRGELVIPAIVSGTFANPKFSPDPVRMAKMKLEGIKQQVAPVNDILNMFKKKPAK